MPEARACWSRPESIATQHIALVGSCVNFGRTPTGNASCSMRMTLMNKPVNWSGRQPR